MTICFVFKGGCVISSFFQVLIYCNTNLSGGIYTKKLTHRQKIKLISTEYKGNECCLCGYNKCIQALEFHHVNPKEKDSDLSSNGYNKSWDKVRTELDKCILVCANCHREIHANLIDKNLLDEKLKISFLVDPDKYWPSLNKTRICPICNTSFEYNDIKQQFCSHECAEISHQKVKRPSKEELQILINTTPFTKIGQTYGVSDNAVRKWCKKYNITKQ